MKTRKQIREEKATEDYEKWVNLILGKKKKKSPVYLWQCVVCGECIHSENVAERHCGRLAQWVSGVEGKGVNMESPKVQIQVSGHIEMSVEDLERILGYPDVQKGLVYSIHMGFCNSENLDFTLPDDIEVTEE